MASSRSSSLCRSEMSWATRSSWTQALSQKPDPFARMHGGLDFAPAPRQNSAQLEDMLATLKEQRGQFQNEHAVQAARLEREFNQLRSATHHVDDPISQTTPSSVSRARNEIGLQDLIQREIQAQQNAAQGGRVERGRMEATTPPHRAHRAQSVGPTPFGGFTDHVHHPEWRHRVDNDAPSHHGRYQTVRISQLYKELESMDAALQQARQENRRLSEEKDVCIAAHERDVQTLEAMLKSVMDENAKLKEFIASSKGKSSPVHGARGILLEELERQMLESGISNIRSTPDSSSTQTPPFEPEAEECSLDLSRASIPTVDENRAATPP